ncbi:MAG TPA: iron-sulfur cluster assembly accessory protein [Armatimonadota bacterium]|nr:iron-sulfur cluster assembly accessory protein [Armatimonadota bacterium]
MALLQLTDLTAPKPQSETVELTPAAVEKVKGMLGSRPELDGKGLRIYVTSGGCAGYSYGMAFDEPAGDDHTLDCSGLKVLVDPESFPWLRGVQVDYKDSLLGSGFEITNPNAASSCGCGTSFSKGDNPPAESGDSCR